MSDSLTNLTATISALGGGLAGAASAAPGNIAGWIDALKGNSQLAGISAELTKLHGLLSGGNIDASQLHQSLHTLGEHTTKAADSADSATSAKVRELGQLLTTAASQLK